MALPVAKQPIPLKRPRPKDPGPVLGHPDGPQEHIITNTAQFRALFSDAVFALEEDLVRRKEWWER